MTEAGVGDTEMLKALHTWIMCRVLPDYASCTGESNKLVLYIVIARVQICCHKHILFHQHRTPLLHLKCYVVDKKRRSVIFGEDIDGELVTNAMVSICDSEDDVVPRGVTIRMMINHYALIEVLHFEHEALYTWTAIKEIRPSCSA